MPAVRLLGGGVFVAALISLLLDVRHALRSGAAFSLTSLDALWRAVDPAGLAAAERLVLSAAPEWLWAYVLQPGLGIPIALLGGVAGSLLLSAGPRRRASRSGEGLALPLPRREHAQPGSAAP